MSRLPARSLARQGVATTIGRIVARNRAWVSRARDWVRSSLGLDRESLKESHKCVLDIHARMAPAAHENRQRAAGPSRPPCLLVPRGMCWSMASADGLRRTCPARRP